MQGQPLSLGHQRSRQRQCMGSRALERRVLEELSQAGKRPIRMLVNPPKETGTYNVLLSGVSSTFEAVNAKDIYAHFYSRLAFPLDVK